MNIIGRLTRDAQVRTLSNEKQVVNFSIATNESYRNKQGERVEQTTFFNCSYWRSSNVLKLLTKGALVELTGSVSTRAWIGKDGEAHSALNFLTSQIKLHGGGKKTNFSHAVAKTESIVSEQHQEIAEDLPF